MSDKESSDEIHVIAKKLQTVTTIQSDDTQQQQQQGKCSARKNNNNDATTRHTVDSKKSCTTVPITSTTTINTMTTSTTTDDYVFIRNLPELNLPEKILFVIDTVKEQQCTLFKLGTGATYPPLFMIKRAVESFVCAKSTIQPGVHEYALMSLGSRDATWLCDYTNNTKSFLNHLEGIAEDVPDEEDSTYDLSQLFEAINARVAIPARNQPAFTSRVILIYGRSNSIPKFHNGQRYLDNLTENPCFFLDVLFVHEPPSDDNKCEAVYAEIAALDTTNFSYIFEVGRTAAKIHEYMAKLLAHPLQRPPQKDASYTLYSMAATQEVHTNV